jgi:hypothetical protein
VDGLKRLTAVRKFMAGEVYAFGLSLDEFRGSEYDPTRMTFRLRIAIFSFERKVDLLDRVRRPASVEREVMASSRNSPSRSRCVVYETQGAREMYRSANEMRPSTMALASTLGANDPASNCMWRTKTSFRFTGRRYLSGSRGCLVVSARLGAHRRRASRVAQRSSSCSVGSPRRTSTGSVKSGLIPRSS